MNFSILCITLCLVYVSADTYGKKGPRCYDCNYAPSGYVLTKGKFLSRVGYQSCALRSDYDRKHVDKWGCKSGMCFIRKDYNGLVYRGCADEDNLPWGVDPSKSCQYQGPNKSLYYFCKGDLCNEGMLGDSAALCGAPVPKPIPAGQPQPQPQPQQPQPQPFPQQPADKRDYGKMGVANQGYGIREERPVPEQNYVDQSKISYQGFGYGTGMCNGNCDHNPSGLFPYPGDNNYFIQCDADFRGNTACTCCKETVIRCPEGTDFDPNVHVCNDKAIMANYH